LSSIPKPALIIQTKWDGRDTAPRPSLLPERYGLPGPSPWLFAPGAPPPPPVTVSVILTVPAAASEKFHFKLLAPCTQFSVPVSAMLPLEPPCDQYTVIPDEFVTKVSSFVVSLLSTDVELQLKTLLELL
jgi:hypothetical protein